MHIRLRLFLLFFAAILASLCAAGHLSAQQSPSDSQASASAAQLVPRCAEIAATGAQFDPLGSVCQYALSPQSLPNFICSETIHRWTNGHRLDIVTAQVTFRSGHDRYSDYTINGKPARSLKDSGGWVSNALFAAELNAIFRPETKAEFQLRRQAKTSAGPATEFAYRFERSGNSVFSLAESYPVVSGSIWIDQSSGRLLRMEAKAARVDPALPLRSYHSRLNYGLVPIAGLGTLQLPVSGETDACLRSGVCYKNELAFHDCRKFGSEATILPGVESEQ
jgi:hypothetical protein